MFAKKYIQVFLAFALLAGYLGLTPQPAQALTACGTTYTVQSGDTLRKIAAVCGTTVYALRRANPEIGASDLIYVGQALYMPGAILDNGNGYATYIIERGDTFRSIATRFGTTVNGLQTLNSTIANINLIYEGQRITVPYGSTVPPVTPQPPTSSQLYTVTWGDTMNKIAVRFNTTVQVLLQLNPKITNPNWIWVGQQIYVPGDGNQYVVQKGDTMRKIASRFGTSVEALLALNPQVVNANWIYVGQVLRIR